MKKVIAAAALVLPILSAGFAAAEEPKLLTDAQMDGVTAGGSAYSFASSDADGHHVFTNAYTGALVEVVDHFSSEVTSINLVYSDAYAGAEAYAD
jgi:hypothetical protein